jgi:formate hydrogenlyase transcriptional activator
MNTLPSLDSMSLCGEYEALLKILQAISSSFDMSSLLSKIASNELLHSVIQFDRAELLLYDPVTHRTDVWHFGSQSLDLAEATQGTLAYEDGPGYSVWTTQESAIFDVSRMTASFPKLAAYRQGDGFASECVLPLTTASRHLGSLHFLSAIPDVYCEDRLHFLSHVASQIAVAVENSLNYEQMRLYEQKLERERDHLHFLLDVSNEVQSTMDPYDLLSGVYGPIVKVCGGEDISLFLHDPAAGTARCYAVYGTRGVVKSCSEDSFPVTGSPLDSVFCTRTSTTFCVSSMNSEIKRSKIVTALIAHSARAVLFAPLIARGVVLGALCIVRRKEISFSAEEIGLIEELAGEIAPAVDNLQAYQEISQLKNQLTHEKAYLEEEIREVLNVDEIVGASSSLRETLSLVEVVAGTDSTVLILGESGTGKELIARAIHNLSERKNRTVVKLNCAAIPSGLLESELFGYEKGAFTGAVAQKIGRLELADKGTLFLDEIGDLPLETQPKLLRVLQEREFERLGGSRSIRVNVRVIAATNCDLEEMVANHSFRRDLFYRLNVFPITVPPLRERREDIPLLVRHFTKKFSQRMKKNISTIPEKTMRALTDLPYPGNIRELENLIERSVIVSRGAVLEVPFTDLEAKPSLARDLILSRDGKMGTLASLRSSSQTYERECILSALEKSNGMIGGPRGAAAILGVKRTSLYTKLRRLGISFK